MSEIKVERTEFANGDVMFTTPQDPDVSASFHNRIGTVSTREAVIMAPETARAFAAAIIAVADAVEKEGGK
jgi:hypothetical protein